MIAINERVERLITRAHNNLDSIQDCLVKQFGDISSQMLVGVRVRQSNRVLAFGTGLLDAIPDGGAFLSSLSLNADALDLRLKILDIQLLQGPMSGKIFQCRVTGLRYAKGVVGLCLSSELAELSEPEKLKGVA